jgi:hypothetical protein
MKVGLGIGAHVWTKSTGADGAPPKAHIHDSSDLEPLVMLAAVEAFAPHIDGTVNKTGAEWLNKQTQRLGADQARVQFGEVDAPGASGDAKVLQGSLLGLSWAIAPDTSRGTTRPFHVEGTAAGVRTLLAQMHKEGVARPADEDIAKV